MYTRLVGYWISAALNVIRFALKKRWWWWWRGLIKAAVDVTLKFPRGTRAKAFKRLFKSRRQEKKRLEKRLNEANVPFNIFDIEGIKL